ncbi:MAG TPA: class E sortase [Acidimicrobiales bacterium]|nr:class E sortase [Acidimicrobiales bacterium]
MDFRRVVGGLGRTMIAAGALILAFVAYQLWGTGITEARHQRDLTRQFEQALQAPPTTTAAPTSAPATSGPAPTVATTLPAGPPPAPEGDAVAILRIPSIGLEKAVVQGVTSGALKRGPGHYPETPMPGQPGNAAVAGHRTTYGAPFSRLDELNAGDPILVTTRQGRFRYEVADKKVVRPTETSVLNSTDDNRLTLTTCEPKFSAARRLIVVATLAGEAVEPPPPPAPVVTTTVPGAPATAPATTTPPAPSEAGEGGLSGHGAENGPALVWGAAAAAVWLLMWLAARFWRRWPAYLLGAPVFLVVLFVFFENFSRLLPANY